VREIEEEIMKVRSVFSISLLSLILSAHSSVLAEPRGDLDKHLKALYEGDWDAQMHDYPTWATSTGDHRFDHLLTDSSINAHERRLQRLRHLVAALQRVPSSALGKKQRQNFDIFLRLKLDSIAELESQSYLMPITNRSGFHISFPSMPRNLPFKTVKNYQNYTARLRAFSKSVDQHITLMRKGIKTGFTLPKIVLKGYQKTIIPHIVKDPRKSLLFKPFESFPNNISKSDQKRLRAAGAEAVRSFVVPGYQRFLIFMKNEYLPAARDSVGISEIPGGRAYYRHRVRKFTTLNVSPEEVHQTGLEEVKRIHGEMVKIIKKLKFKGSFVDFVKFLRTDPRFYAKSPEQLLKEVAYVLKKMDGALPKLFKKLPRAPYGIRKVPDFIAPRTTTAYYGRPAGDGSRAGFYYVNTYDLKSRPLYEVEALSLHEAVPGHHLQIALQQELKDLPKFRRFSGFTAFVEGWALYAERLGLEVGFYTDPYSNFGRLSYEMWRACRLVVDTGMHYKSWSRSRAINYMKKYTSLTEHNIVTEIDRYISWPGQALAYKTGELTIRRLRKQSEQALGTKFDVREFHDVVLRNGSVPLKILEEEVTDWIKNKGGSLISPSQKKKKLY
jgi:uncharacterized protein (DUF885 family)